MARKKKKKGRLPPKAGLRKEEGEGAFNPLLRELKALKRKQKEPPVTPQQLERGHSRHVKEEQDYFAEAMSGVTPLRGGNRIITRVPDPDAARPNHPANSGDLEVMAHLSDLVSGVAEMDITFSDEYIEGSVPGFDRKLMQKLKQGHFPIQDHMDLHGFTRPEAELRVRDFLLNGYRMGLRCVLVVHGRGLNSEDHIPVLKERLPVWLSRGPVKRIVLAFSTAQPYDGGTGAIYILLRRPKGRV